MGQKESNQSIFLLAGKLKFTEEPKDSYLVLDSDTEIKCIAEAEVKPKVHWIKGSWRSDGSLGFNSHVLDSDGILYFRGVQMIDAGLYTCIAHTSDGVQQAYINKTIVVRVVGKYYRQRTVPFITLRLRSIGKDCVISEL